MNGKPGEAAGLIAAAYEGYRERFRELTAGAAVRFRDRDWLGAQEDAVERLMIYGEAAYRALAQVEPLLRGDHAAGTAARSAYAGWCAGRDDVELAESFFNSVIRRAYDTAGVDPTLEFVGEDIDDPPAPATPLARRYTAEAGPEDLLRRILRELPVPAPFRDLEGDSALAAPAFRAELRDTTLQAVEVLPHLFYRSKGAYAVGRILTGNGPRPLVLCLLHPPGGVELDALLLTADEASVVFGFTRAYFQVATDRPRQTIDFLRSVMPHKRMDELYTAIGHNRHGKAELYRALIEHLHSTGARFEPAPGVPGLVMTVFTLPTFNVVFKVIRDGFDLPKRTTRRAVMEKYHFIFFRDRVGRLADAQEFNKLELERAAFADGLVERLVQDAGRTVKPAGDRVVIEHLYTERRVTPLDIFLRGAPEAAAVGAILDYGEAIKDMARANIFPGDMLFKNFGVTRHGRIVFYDYDEVSLLTDLTFRALPSNGYDDGEFGISAGELDVFPEEFERFMLLPGRLGEAFREAHSDLFDVRFWRDMQERQRRGELVDFFPYRRARRLRG